MLCSISFKPPSRFSLCYKRRPQWEEAQFWRRFTRRGLNVLKWLQPSRQILRKLTVEWANISGGEVIYSWCCKDTERCQSRSFDEEPHVCPGFIFTRAAWRCIGANALGETEENFKETRCSGRKDRNIIGRSPSPASSLLSDCLQDIIFSTSWL